MAISPDTHWLVTASRDATAILWDLSAAEPTKTALILRGHEGIISKLIISSDSRWLVTAGYDGTARLWDLNAPNPNATAHSEFTGWMGKIREQLGESQRDELRQRVNQYWSKRGQDLLSVLGGMTPLGGVASPHTFGELSGDRMKLSIIRPYRPLLDALAFSDADGGNDGIELGRRAALAPFVLSDHLDTNG